MKKIFITISLIIPLALSAFPVFAANTFTPTSYTATSTVAIANYDFAIATFNPDGTIYTEHCVSGHSGDFSLTCDGQNSLSGPIMNTFIGNPTTFRVVEFETSDGTFNCWVANDYNTCASQGRTHTFTITFVPPPYRSINRGDLTVPASTTQDLLASATNVISNLGFLAILIIAMAIPLVFWFARQIIALISKKNEKNLCHHSHHSHISGPRICPDRHQHD